MGRDCDREKVTEALKKVGMIMINVSNVTQSVKVFTLCNKVQAPLTTYGGDYISWNGIIFSFNLWRSIVFLWGEFIAAGRKAFLDGAR